MKKKLFTIFLSIFTAVFIFNQKAVVLADVYSDSAIETVDDSNYNISTSNDNQVVISDATGETTLTQLDENHFTMSRNDGTVSAVEVDNQGNVYVDGALAKAANEVNSTSSAETKGQYFTAAISNWHYLDTIYNDTNIQGQREAIALTLVGLVPYLGPAVTIASIIQSVQNYGSPVMYITTKRYYADGYQYYKYVNYFYSDPGRRNLVRTTTEIKKMW